MFLCSEKLTLEEKIASAMINTFQLTESEVTSLREGDINEEFFRVLERAATIHNDCRSLMQSGHQVIAIEIMEQMAVFQVIFELFNFLLNIVYFEIIGYLNYFLGNRLRKIIQMGTNKL